MKILFVLVALSYPIFAGHIILDDELKFFDKKDTKKIKYLKKITEVFE